MARWKFILDDRIVVAALSAASSFSTGSSRWWDTELVDEINERQLDGTPDVTVRCLNEKFGTKETGSSPLFSALVIRNCTRKGERCEYYFAAQGTSLSDFLDLNPQWSTEGSSGSSEAPRSRAPARRYAATTPREKEGPSQVVTANSTQQKRRSDRSVGKSGTPAKQKPCREPVDTATLLGVRGGVSDSDDEEDETRREFETRVRGELTVAFAKKDAAFKKCKEDLKKVEKQSSEYFVELQQLRREKDIVTVRAQNADRDDDDELNDEGRVEALHVAKQMVDSFRALSVLRQRLVTLALFATLLTEKEQGSLRRSLPAAGDEEGDFVEKAGEQFEAFKEEAGDSQTDTFKRLFDHQTGLPRDVSVEEQVRVLNKYPLLASIIKRLTFSGSFLKKTANAQAAAAREAAAVDDDDDDNNNNNNNNNKTPEGFRFDHTRHEKKADGSKGDFVKPTLSGAALIDCVKGRLHEVASRMCFHACMLVSTSSRGTVQTTVGLLMSLALVWLGRMSQLGASYVSRIGIGAGRTTIFNMRLKVAAIYATNVVIMINLLVWQLQSFGLLFVTDNYALLQWAAHKQTNTNFTSISDTMTFMVYPMKGRGILNRDPQRPPAMPPSFDALLLLKFFAKHHASYCPKSPTMTVDPTSTGVFNATLFPPDEEIGYASLKDFFPLPSLLAKSSKITDLLGVVMVAIKKVMSSVWLAKDDLFVLVDGEPFLLFDVAAKLVFGDVNMVAVLLAVFHLQKHLVEDSFMDQKNFTQIYGPFLVFCMNYRASHFQTLLNKRAVVQPEDDDEEVEEDAQEAVTRDMRQFDVFSHKDETVDEMRQRKGVTEDDVQNSFIDAVDDDEEEEEEEEEGEEEQEESATEQSRKFDEEPRDTGCWWGSFAERASNFSVFRGASSKAGVAGLPNLGGGSFAATKGSKINYGRLRYFAQLLFAAFLQTRAWIVTKTRGAYMKANPAPEAVDGQATVAPVDVAEHLVLEWACRTSPKFQMRWNFFENELRMYIEPFCQWEKGDSTGVYNHLPVYILHLCYYANQAHWRKARVAPWLLSHLAATLYRIRLRPDLLKLAAMNCKRVYDAFIEHLNAVIKRDMPTNTPIEPKHVVAASSSGDL
jgi:hypothetical protein